MNLNLNTKKKSFSAKKGDIIVTKSIRVGAEIHYLIIEDRPNEGFTLLNMNSNNLMSPIKADSPVELIEVLQKRISTIEIIEIIPSNEIEVTRK